MNPGCQGDCILPVTPRIQVSPSPNLSPWESIFLSPFLLATSLIPQYRFQLQSLFSLRPESSRKSQPQSLPASTLMLSFLCQNPLWLLLPSRIKFTSSACSEELYSPWSQPHPLMLLMPLHVSRGAKLELRVCLRTTYGRTAALAASTHRTCRSDVSSGPLPCWLWAWPQDLLWLVVQQRFKFKQHL